MYLGWGREIWRDMNADVILSKTAQIVSLVTGLSVVVNAPRAGWYKNSSDIVFIFPEVGKDITMTFSDHFLLSDTCISLLPNLLMDRMRKEGITS